MSKRVVLCDDNRERLARLVLAVREAGGEPVEAARAQVLRLCRGAQAIVAAGEEGLEALARLALDRPMLPRLALVDPALSREGLLALVERIHPFALLPEPLDRARLTAALLDALTSTAEGVTDATHRTTRLPAAAPDFERLIRDRLTGANGYHYLRLRLDEELERAARYTRPLALVLVDVDDLRGINDRWGRAAGDQALKQVATTLMAGARAVDHVGRWAGGAFALLLPETNAGAAYGIAERLRADIAARRFQETLPQAIGPARAPARMRLTVSCGVACTVREGASQPASLLRRTDAALERAKLGGRNRSIVDGGA
jgi:diguanylate cyclase (GGDEF)-like protein